LSTDNGPLYLLEPHNLKDMMQVTDRKRKRTDVAWKPDYTMFAVGHEDGLVMLLVKSSSSSGFFLLPLSL